MAFIDERIAFLERKQESRRKRNGKGAESGTEAEVRMTLPEMLRTVRKAVW